jgi:hypothetical protein
MSKPKFPEREVLKDVLARLKTKTVSSESYYRGLISPTYQAYERIVKDIKESESKTPDMSRGLAIGLLGAMSNNYSILIQRSFELVEDLKLYILSLEKYCAELDKARWKGIQEATKKIMEANKKLKEETPSNKEPKKSTDYIK